MVQKRKTSRSDAENATPKHPSPTEFSRFDEQTGTRNPGLDRDTEDDSDSDPDDDQFDPDAVDFLGDFGFDDDEAIPDRNDFWFDDLDPCFD